MRSRAVSIFLAAALAIPGAGSAQSIEDRVIGELRRQGFSEFTVARTLLGRVRIEAENRRGRREIVINPNTGAILRDYFYPLVSGGKGGVPSLLGGGSSGSGSSGSGSGIDDDEDDDDEDDDEDDEDDKDDESDEGDDEEDDEEGNSGSGGGNSGSGSGNSGSGGGDDDDDDDD